MLVVTLSNIKERRAEWGNESIQRNPGYFDRLHNYSFSYKASRYPNWGALTKKLNSILLNFFMPTNQVKSTEKQRLIESFNSLDHLLI